jgi:hypothetical protein
VRGDIEVQIPLGGGVDESTDERFIPATSMLVCDNAVFPDGQTVRPRAGMTALSTLVNAKRLIARKDEVLIVDGVNAWAYSPAAAAGGNVGNPIGLSSRGRVSPCMITRSPIAGGTAAPSASIAIGAPFASVAEGNGYRISVWCDGTAVGASVFDVANDVFARSAESLNVASGSGTSSISSQPRAMVVGTTAIVVYYEKSSGKVLARSMDLTAVAGGWSGEVTLSTFAANGALIFDASPVTGGSTFAVIICDPATTAVSQVIIDTFDTSLAMVANTLAFTLNWSGAGYTGYNFTACAIRAVNSDNVLVASFSHAYFNPGTGFDVNQLGVSAYPLNLSSPVTAWWYPVNETGSSALGIVQAIGLERNYGVGSGTTSRFVLTWTRLSEQASPVAGNGAAIFQTLGATWYALFSANNAFTTHSPEPMQCVAMMGKPLAVTISGALHVLLPCMFYDPAQPTGIVYDLGLDTSQSLWTPFVPVAVTAPRYSAATAPIVVAGSFGRIPMPIPRNSDVTFCGDALRSKYTVASTVASSATTMSVVLNTIDFSHPGLWQTVSIGDYTYIAGAMPTLYDGVSVTEVGFLHAPPPLAVTNLSGSGGAVPTMTGMQYRACYAQADGAGNIHRSPPSDPIIFNTQSAVANQKNNLAVIPCRSTLRQPVSPTSGEIGIRPITIEIYRNTVATPGILQLVAILDNDITNGGVIAFTDTHADVDVASNPILYTAGGSVPSECPPSLSALAVHADRIFGISEDGRTQYFTTPLTSGEAPRFTDAFTITWPSGPVTACWSLESKLHAATASEIWYLFGQGPSDNGAGSDFTSPQQWQSNVGVVDPRGAVNFEMGTILNTSRGVYIETRAGELKWLGQRFQRTYGTYPIASSFVPMTTDGAVRIILRASEDVGSMGTTVHWDYRNDRISYHRYSDSTYGVTNAVTADGVLYSLVVASVFGTTAGVMFKEDSTVTTDAGAFVPLRLKTAWIKSADLQGYQRVRRAMLLGQSNGSHGITLSLATNYSGTPDATFTWTYADVASLTLEQLRATPSVQKCSSIQATITTTDGSPSGQTGPTLDSLLFVVGNKGTETKRVAAAQER